MIKRLVGYKFRIYPTEDQKSFFANHFGCCRLIYNHFLWLRRIAYQRFGLKTNFFRLKKELPRMKKTEKHSFLKLINSQSLQEALYDLEKAFKRFFKGLGSYPVFKKKSSKQSFKIPQNFYLKKSKRANWYLVIPKLHSGIKIRVHREVVGNLKQLTISLDSTGKYYASFNCEQNGFVFVKKALYKYGAIDLGLISCIVTDKGKKIEAPKFFRKLEKKLIAAYRLFSKKVKFSANWHKALKVVAKVHEEIANKRRNFLHHTSLDVVIENQVTYIEDLFIKGLLKNKKLAKSFSDGSLGEFVRMLIYKSEWRGRKVHKIGRFEPSSKMCHVCDIINNDLKLSDREWRCSCCHTLHDRDINAAKNILKIGLQMSLGKDKPEVKPVERLISAFPKKRKSKLTL